MMARLRHLQRRTLLRRPPLVEPAPEPARLLLAKSTPPPNSGLPFGSLSSRFESNGKPGAIGWDANGGFSYGEYQIASKTGAMTSFLTFLQTNFTNFYTALIHMGGNAAALTGTDGFKQAWRVLAAKPAFVQAQNAFIKFTHYDPLLAHLKAAPGLNADNYSIALKNVIWSVAVQYGSASKLIQNALQDKTIAAMTETQIIEAVYNERNNVGKYFPRSTPQVQKALLARFAHERALALAEI